MPGCYVTLQRLQANLTRGTVSWYRKHKDNKPIHQLNRLRIAGIMAAAVSSNIESHIRTTADTKRIRPSEFFLDFDRLRSGFVTETQFFRVLWENLGVKLTDDQMTSLRQKYDLKGDGRMNYRMFCEIINQPFNPNDLTTDPAKQRTEPTPFLGTVRSLRPMSPSSESKIQDLLKLLQQYYIYRGVNLRTCCEDFDRHHIGVIQESQFYRSFPRPPEVTEEAVNLLVQKYRDPDRPGLLNYLNLHHDLQAIGQQFGTDGIEATLQSSNIGDFLPSQAGAGETVQLIFDRIRVAVYKNRIRTIEFFKDYDKLRSGIITENQFVCGLSLAIGKEAQLTRAETQKIAEFYRTPDSRVAYKEFCDMMENAFNIPDLEKKPTQSVVRPPEGALGRNLPGLTSDEEQHIREVLLQLADQVCKRRLMMYQYFKDYDRSKGYSRVITPTQFGRILHFLSLNVSLEDFKLLCRKFADPSTGDVNYPAFVQCVDKEFVNYTQDSTSAKTKARTVEVEPEKVLDLSSVNMDDLMARIRHHALTNRRRVQEYFQDFDPLRSGSLTKSQFRRGLSDFGLSALGHHNLSEAQFEVLCAHYINPQMPDKIQWTKFMTDIDSVFTQRDLEKNPAHQVPSQEIFVVPKPGTMDWICASDEHKQQVGTIMERLRQRANQRRVLPKPIFQDFDKHNNGHVTRPQFRQCMTMLELPVTEAEMLALEAKFCNDTGFNYLAFLSELQPVEPPKMMYQQRLEEMRQVNQAKGITPAFPIPADVEGVLVKVKTKVFKERIRVHEWMRDYDKLRSGRMGQGNFRRALDLCKFELSEPELALLEDHYSAPGFPNFVDYVRFSDDVESIFTTKDLEKAPLLEVEQFQPPVEWEMNHLSPDMEGLLTNCMERLSQKVRKNRMQLYPLFEDYDRVHNGTVSRSQFRRVLSELELASLVPTEQEWVCLWKKFEMTVGGKNDVNYNAFCEEIYKLAKFEWRKP